METINNISSPNGLTASSSNGLTHMPVSNVRLSVIIPVYNVKPYLRQCVDSVLAQTYTNIEIILVDDGSTDGSADIIREYADSEAIRLKGYKANKVSETSPNDLISSSPNSLIEATHRLKTVFKPNGGLSDARNAGLRVATGEYVAFLDSDDVYLLKDGLELLMALAQTEQPDVLLFQAVDVYPHHQTVRKAYDVDYMATHSGTEVFAQLVRTQSFNMSACFQLIRRELLEQYQIYFEKGLLSEDVDWSLRLWRHVSKVRAINLPLYGYQHREGSISTTYTIRNLRSYEHIFAKFVQLYKERVVEAAAELYWQMVMGYLAQMYTSCIYAYGQISSANRNEAKNILTKYVQLLDYSVSIKSDRVVLVERLIGMQSTILFFALYGWLKRKVYKIFFS